MEMSDAESINYGHGSLQVAVKFTRWQLLKHIWKSMWTFCFRYNGDEVGYLIRIKAQSTFDASGCE